MWGMLVRIAVGLALAFLVSGLIGERLASSGEAFFEAEVVGRIIDRALVHAEVAWPFALFAIALAEFAGIRALAYYVAAGALAAIAAAAFDARLWEFKIDEWLPRWRDVLLTSGILGGFTYWLVQGHRVGWRGESEEARARTPLEALVGPSGVDRNRCPMCVPLSFLIGIVPLAFLGWWMVQDDDAGTTILRRSERQGTAELSKAGYPWATLSIKHDVGEVIGQAPDAGARTAAFAKAREVLAPMVGVAGVVERLEDRLTVAPPRPPVVALPARPQEAPAPAPAAQAEAKRKAEAEAARSAAEAAAKRKSEEDARKAATASAEAKRKDEETRRLAAEAESRRRAEEARGVAEAEAKRKAEEEARRVAEAEAKRKAEEEARRVAEAEAKRKADEEARRVTEADAKRKADEEARRVAEAEAKRKADEEARRVTEADAKRKADEEARRVAEAEVRRKAEEEMRRLAAAADVSRRAAEEARRFAEAEERRKTEAARVAVATPPPAPAAPAAAPAASAPAAAAVAAQAAQSAPVAASSDCPADQLSLIRETRIGFVLRKGLIAAEDRGKLDQIAAALKRCTGVGLRVAGHADRAEFRLGTGSLSQQRAQRIAAELVRRGVARERIETVAYGILKPPAAGVTGPASRVELSTAQAQTEVSDACKAELAGLRLPFGTASDRMIKDNAQQIDKIATTILDCRMPRVVVEGHTDQIGSAAYNMALSLRRARAVRTALIARGVPPRAVVAAGFGESRPLDASGTAAANTTNRRVAFVLGSMDQPGRPALAAPKRKLKASASGRHRAQAASLRRR